MKTDSIRKMNPTIHSDGTKAWYLNYKLHREDGPAIEYPNGSKEWWLNGHCHREDGPAVEYASGTKEWWLNNEFLTEGERPENWKELILLTQIEKIMNE